MEGDIKWTCPKCGSMPEKHGKGGEGKCQTHQYGERSCQGFLCECDDPSDNEDHGASHEFPCGNAVCYHCGWCGEFPIPLFDPKKLKGWKKTAWAAGWRPPIGVRP